MLNRPTVYLLYVQHLSGFSCFPELTQLHADLVCYIGPIRERRAIILCVSMTELTTRAE